MKYLIFSLLFFQLLIANEISLKDDESFFKKQAEIQAIIDEQFPKKEYIEEIDDEMAIHLENGKFVASLSLVWRGSYGMTLNNNLTIKKFKCLEKSPDSEDDLDYQTILDNELAEYGPLYGQLSQSLSSWFQETVE